jgi:hypothetical protein
MIATPTIESVTAEIKDLILILRFIGAHNEAVLLEADLWVAGDDLRELLMVREYAEENLCPTSDCS